MKTEYKRDLQNNYLVLEPCAETEEDSYRMYMLEQNNIQGLLAFHSSRKDGVLQFYYEITSMQPLDSVFERKAMGCQDIISLLSGIRDVLENLQKYLLNPKQILFAPQYIFLHPERGSVHLCYIPAACSEMPITFLAEFILKRLDHGDYQAVELGYRFYQKALEENFSIQETLQEILMSVQENNNSNSKGETAEKSAKVEKTEDPEAFYEVVHKTRKIHEEPRVDPKKFSEKLFSVIHPAVLLSGLFLIAVLEIVYYFGFLSLTETGGVFFLLISLEVLCNKHWRRVKEKKLQGENRWVEDEEEEMYRMLQEEMYEKAAEKETEQPIEETCCLVNAPGENYVKLVCTQAADRGKYPDIIIGSEPVYIGKIRGESDIILDSPTVSRRHAMLVQRAEGYRVKDLNSRNGTYCNGERLCPQEERSFQAGDIIAFAEIAYRVL